MSKLPKVLQSSKNSNNVSLTIKSLVFLLVSLAVNEANSRGFEIPTTEIDEIVTIALGLISSVGATWGIIRKYRK